MSQGWKRPSLRGALISPRHFSLPCTDPGTSGKRLPHTDGEPVTQGRLKSGGDRFLALGSASLSLPSLPHWHQTLRGLMDAALPSYPI